MCIHFRDNSCNQKLKKLIMYTCISDIPPGAGTNGNERFHHHINSLLNKSKVGILLACPFLAVVIHAYNHSSKRKSRLVIESISNSKISIGLVEVQELTPVGILHKGKQQKVDSSDNWEIDLSTSVIDLEMIVTIYTKKSLRKLQLFKSF